MKFRIETADDELFVFEETQKDSMLVCIQELLEGGVPFSTSYHYTWQEIAEMESQNDVTEIAYHPNYH
jgi:hypothetical protein